jgi:hypothetical protein
MDTNKAAYWIALGVLVLGLSSAYRHGRFPALHRVAERADFVMCRISTHATQTLAVALGMTSREELPVADLLAASDGVEIARSQAALVREQALEQAELIRARVREQVRAQADVIREQAEMQRAQIEQIRWRTASQIRLVRTANRRVMVVCPKTGARVTVDRGAELADISPDVQVDDTF